MLLKGFGLFEKEQRKKAKTSDKVTVLVHNRTEYSKLRSLFGFIANLKTNKENNAVSFITFMCSLVAIYLVFSSVFCSVNH